MKIRRTITKAQTVGVNLRREHPGITEAKRGEGGVSQMLTFAYVGGGGQDPCLRNHIYKILTHVV